MIAAKQNNSTRDAILGSIRRNLAASAPFDAVHEEHHGGRETAEITYPASILSTGELAEMFRENLVSIGGNCAITDNRKQAAGLIREVIGNSNAKKIAVSDSVLAHDITSGLKSIEIVENAGKEELFSCDVGITGAQWGIAETGTLVLESGKERNRLASLVPPIHIALLEAKNIRQRMSEILTLVSDGERSGDQSRAVTFITGPSRTSDIELTLAIGVHGPAELHVFIIND
jgi:L-lactate dehydrogenase complex protein LldG